MTRNKRKPEVIDLIDSDEENTPPNSKSVKTQHKSSASQRAPSNVNKSQKSPQARPNDSFTPQAFTSILLGGLGHDQSERDLWSASQDRWLDDDMHHVVDMTADSEEDDAYEGRQLYGIMNTKIVGIRFYSGRATIGEYVVIRREPHNPYDSNAIRIDNVVHQQIGHIGRQVAAKLQPYIDSGDLVIEGTLTGEKGDYDCPIALKLFGTSDPVKAQELKARMQADKLPVVELNKAERERNRREKELTKQQKARQKAAQARSKNGNTVIDIDQSQDPRYAHLNTAGAKMSESDVQLDEILSNTTMYNPREVQDAVGKLGYGKDMLEKMKMAEQPIEIKTTLLPYQRQGLQWLLDHESPHIPNNGDAVQFWKRSKGIYTNVATNFSVTQVPELASGGILADDMGLGKTIQIISLIVADRKKNGQPTLIVAPLSVMSNWKNQAALHVKKKYALNVLIYHGPENRSLTPTQFKEYDIVVTTYQTMTMELFAGKDQPAQVPTKNGLYSLRWRRVVLDEGHQIRNPKTKMSQAAYHLDADSRWILSGTPIVNNLKDLYSHVKFLRLSGGLNEFDIFSGTIIRPIKNRSSSAQFLLRALMQTLCLRRMKDMDFIDLKLPALSFHKSVIKFFPHEQDRYDAFKAEASGLVEAAKARKGGSNTMTHLLEVLLRLRQTCNHWRMCGEERVSRLLALVEENKIVDVNSPANRRALQDLLQLKLDSQEDCPVCMETLTNRDIQPVITPCAHVFCSDCINRTIETQHKCPMCRADLEDASNLISPAANFGEADTVDSPAVPEGFDPNESSSKIEAIIQLLKATTSKSAETKTVIFSQWTSFLSLLEPHLLNHGILYTRLDGTLSPLKRDVAIETLTTNPGCKVMLASLSACSVGINLTAASQVILADSWWAPAVEDQAVDRVYRLGQEKECRVVRFVMEGSVEEEVLEVQTEKRNLVGVAFGEEARKREQQGRLADIERLLR